MPLTADLVRTLVEWLGEEGAVAGLERSHWRASELLQLAKEMDRSVKPKTRRKELVSEIVYGATKRIDKTVEELLAMNSDQIMDYLDERRPSKVELLKVLEELDFRPGSEGQKNLYRYAARQISETGMFQRVARSSPR